MNTMCDLSRQSRFFVLLAAMFLCVPEVAPAETKDASGEPPSLQEIIRNVRKANRGLERAIVRIRPGPGAPDGGGRLYWRRDAFVRSRNYRLDSKGRLHLYDVVTDSSRTSVLFNTIHSNGRSFTFGMALPHERLPDTGYGLLDYFQLEFAAERGVDVKYPGYPMMLNLFPERLKLYEQRYQRSYRTSGGKRYIVLRRERVLLREFYFTETLYLNPSTWRFEKVQLEDGERRYILSVPSFQTVSGVSLPRAVRVTSPGFQNPLPYVLKYQVRHKDLPESNLRKPDWVNDPGLPEISNVDNRFVHRRIRRNRIDDDLYQALMQAAIRYRYMLFPSHFHARPFKQSVELANERHPDSRLLKAFRDGIYSKTRVVDRDRAFITAFPSIRKTVQHPYMNYAAAYRAFRQKAYEKARDYIEPIRTTFPYGRATERLQFLKKLRKASSSESVRSLLEEYVVGVKPARHLGRVQALLRILQKKNRENWVKVLRTIVEKKPAPLLRLTLAKYYQAQKNYRQANRLFSSLTPIPYFRRLILTYVQEAGFHAESLIQNNLKSIPFVWLLIRLAAHRVRDGVSAKDLQLIRRALSLLKDSGERVIGTIPPGRENDYLSDLASMIRRLQRQGEGDLMGTLLRRLMQTYRLPWDHSRLVHAAKRMAEDDPATGFRLSRAFLLRGFPEVSSDLMSAGSVRRRLLKRLNDPDPGFRNYLALARLITHRPPRGTERLRRITQRLKEGIKRFPQHQKRPYIMDALGSLYYLKKRYGRALSTFRKLLNHVRSSEPPERFEALFASVSVDRVRSVYSGETVPVDPGDPVLVKLASALDKSDHPPEKASRTLSAFTVLHGKGLSPALAFGIIGRQEAGLRLLIHRLRQSQDKPVTNELLGIVTELLEERNRYAALAIVLRMVIREKNLEDRSLRKRYRRAQKKMDRSKLIEDLRNQDLGNASPSTKRKVGEYLRKIATADGQRSAMKYVSRILRMKGRVAPVLLGRLNEETDRVRPYLRRMLQTLRLRQIQRNMFPESDLR